MARSRSAAQSRKKRNVLPSASTIRSANTMRRRSPLMLLLLILMWSLILGWGLSQGLSAQTQLPAAETQTVPAPDPAGLVDVVTDRYQLGQQFYLEKCSTCHIALPPQVMPTQTWASLLQDSQHYGATIQPLVEPSLQIAWDYISTYSRPIIERERVPYRLTQSRYFKALHPNVEFTEPISPSSCISCHPAAAQFNFRQLTSAWDNSP